MQNAELLAKWLGDAKYYVSKYRPVPVEEHLVFENAVYPVSTSKLLAKTATQLTGHVTSSSSTQARVEPTRLIEASIDKELSKPLLNAVIALAIETASKGYGALVFCSSRAGAERDAELISRAMFDLSQVSVQTVEGRNYLLNDLRSTASGLDQTLEKTIPAGVAFHRKPHDRILEPRLTSQTLA